MVNPVPVEKVSVTIQIATKMGKVTHHLMQSLDYTQIAQCSLQVSAQFVP